MLQFVMLECALTICPHCIALIMQEISERTGQGRWTLRTAQMTAPGVPGNLTWRACSRLSRRSRRACRQLAAGHRARGVPPPCAGSTPGCARARHGRRRCQRCLPASARTSLQVPGNEDTVLLSHHVQLLELQYKRYFCVALMQAVHGMPRSALMSCLGCHGLSSAPPFCRPER